MRSVVMSTLPEVTIITGDLLSAGIPKYFATRTVVCSGALGLDNLCDSMLDVLDRSLFLPNFATGVEYMGIISLSMRKIPLNKREMYMMPSRTLTPKLSTIQNDGSTCRVSIFTINGMIPFTFIDYFVAF